MVTTLFKSTLREIRGSLGRYVAIMAIIALGVGVYGGLRMSQPCMMDTGVEYIDEYSLFDFRLLSTLGFTEEDVAAFDAMDGVALARGAVYTDFLAEWTGEDELVFTALSLTDGINEPKLTAGWMPKNGGECLGDARFFSEEDLGKTIGVSKANDEDTRELLSGGSYTLVGLMQTPYYLSSMERGTSAIGGGSVSAFIYIPESGFDFEAYYEVFLKLEDTADSYSGAYKDQIDAFEPFVEKLTEERADLRYETVYADALEELADAEKEVADGWEEYKSEKADAEQELADAYEELTDGEQEYKDGLADVEQGWIDYADGVEEYEDGVRELQDAKIELEDAEAELRDAEAELQDAKAQLDDAAVELQDAKTQIDDAKAELQDAKAQLQDAKAELEDAEAELDHAKRELDVAYAKLKEGEAGYASLSELYGSAAAMAQMAGMSSPEQLMAVLGSGAVPELDAAVDQALQAQGSSLGAFLGGWAGAEASIGQPLTGAYLAQLQLSLHTGWEEYNRGLAEYDRGYVQYQNGLTKYGNGLAEYEDGLAEYEKGVAEYEDGLAEYEDGVAEYEDGKAKYEDGLAEYENGLSEYEDGKKELEDAARELEDAKKELLDAETELADARIELTDGWAEYEDGKAEADSEFADAYEELTDAEREIEDGYEELGELEEAVTYVFTRSENAGYISFDNDTSIVAAVAVVFPLFFFLVAALVCVTTMTRMVDEQRTQIGVLKALGYSSGQIMGKYVIYSGSAALLGSAIGYALGSTALPWVIWQIYGIMYDFAPLNFLFDPMLAALTFAAALLCSVGSTFMACRAELREVAAELIRPKTPKAGKRVALEYITPLWKRLSFLHKVSVRNVLRYRSRLIMMVLGIGGCTALLVAGFGLKDSLTSVIDEQFEKITLYDYGVTFSEELPEGELDAYLSEMGWQEGLLVHSGSIDIVTEEITKSASLVISRSDSLEGYITLCRGEERIEYPGTDEIVLNEGLAQKLALDVGDKVSLRNGDGEMLSVSVSAICDSFVGNCVYLSRETYERQTGGEIELQTLYLHGHDGADPYAEGVTLSDWETVSRVTVNEANRDYVGRMLERLDLLVIVIVICAGALAFIVLYNLTNINITERIREIATIKVLGFFRGEVASYVYREIYMLSVLGSFAGLFMGRALHAFIMAQVKIDAVYFPTIVELPSYFYSVGLTLVFTVLISFVMRPRLAGVRMAESLKSVE